MALTDNGQKKRIIIIAVCSVILVGIVVTVSIGFTEKSSKKESTNTKKNYQISDSLKAIKSICQPTDFKQTCEEQLRKEAGNSTDVKELMQAAFKAGVNFATQAADNSATLREVEQDPKSKMALENCKNLLTFSIYEFQKSISKINELDAVVFNKIYGDLKIWLSATITNQQTCLDGFQNTMTVTGGKMEKVLNMSMKLSRIGLAIVGELSDAFNQLELQGISRRLLEEREMHVLGHSYWPSMMDKNPWKHHLVKEKEAYVLGHANWFTMLDENNPLERRLLQEKEPPAIKSICQPTDFKQTCEEQLRKEAGNSTDVKELMQAAFKAGVNFATQAADNSATLREVEQDPKSKMALENCKNLLTFSIYEFQKSISKINELDAVVFNKIYGDLKIWLSATITNQQTCLDGFQNTMTVTGGKMEKVLNMSMKLSRIGLAIVGELSDAFNQLELQGISRRLLEEREMHVLGHSYWPSMMDKNPWKHHLVKEKEAYVLGHANWFTMLDENNPLERRLLQEKEPPVLDRADRSSMLDEISRKHRLLQEKEPPLLGHIDWSSMIENRRFLQEKEPPVAGHEEPSEMLNKRSLLQEKEPPVAGHKEPSEMLDQLPLLQGKEPHVPGDEEPSEMLDKQGRNKENELHVAGHEEPSEVLDKRRRLQENELHVDGHEEPSEILDQQSQLQENELHVAGNELDKRSRLQENKLRVSGHEEPSEMLDKRRRLLENELQVDGHEQPVEMLDKWVAEVLNELQVDGHEEPSKMLDKRLRLQEIELRVARHRELFEMLDKRRRLQKISSMLLDMKSPRKC
ncbi:hypothetical protein GOBAR_DD11247 [Gossypium barbadense]|nr:hypothetical protein GOBAR_DD11247 [Gossypium barbadense]